MSHEEGDCVAPLAWGCGDQADWHLAGRKVWRHSCSLLLWVPTGSLRHTVSKWRGVKSLSAALFSFSARVFFPWDCLWVSVWGCTTETFHRSHHILSFLFLYSVSCGWFSVFLFFSTTLAKVFILVSNLFAGKEHYSPACLCTQKSASGNMLFYPCLQCKTWKCFEVCVLCTFEWVNNNTFTFWDKNVKKIVTLFLKRFQTTEEPVWNGRWEQLLMSC